MSIIKTNKMKAIVTKNFKTSKKVRVTKGTLVTILPLIGVTGRVDLVQIIGDNFKMNTLKSLAINLTTL